MFRSCAGDNSSSKITVPISFSLTKFCTSFILPLPINVFGLGMSSFWVKRLTTFPPAVKVKNSSSSKYSLEVCSS